MRRATIAVLAVALAGVALLAVAATLGTHTSRAFTLGVQSQLPSHPVQTGETLCQRPIRVPPGGDFDRIDFQVGTDHRIGGPLEVTVHEVGGGFTRRGVLPGGYPDVAFQQRHVVRVGHVPDRTTIEVCFRNRGGQTIAIFGSSDGALARSSSYLDGTWAEFDLDIVFRRGEQRSFATLLPEIARRASLFRPPWASPGLLYALVLLLLVGAPLLLARALRSLE
jgi:hypothetical protein